MEQYIVDGYNLIHSNEKLKSILKIFPQEAREKLVGMISDFIGRKKIKATIVFDGAEPINEKHRSRNNIRIIYSHSQIADTEIKHLIDAAKVKRILTIVSSDNEILNYAKISGAKSIRSGDFLEMITVKKNEVEFVKNSELTKGEIDYWMKIFKEEKN